MLVPLIACEPAAFLFPPDGVIKQMGCDDVEHKPDEPRDRSGTSSCCASHCATEAVAAAGMERMARCWERESGLEAGSKCFPSRWQRGGKTKPVARRRGDLRVIDGETVLQKLSD